LLTSQFRSDSDLHTFGFPWRPWTDPRSIADGASIRNYIEESAKQYGIDRNTLFHHRVTAAAWSSGEQQWSLVVDTDAGQKTLTARFVVFSTGYYSYTEPLETTIAGIEDFKGQTVHPQFWPEDLDCTGKKIVVIGSGATSVTLLPALAQKASKVTMLQRSPSYVLSQPSVDPLGKVMRRLLPSWLAIKIVRSKFLIIPFLFYQFCLAYPNAARWALRRRAQRELPKNIPHDPNFCPSYNPWEQRLCVTPDGDFYAALRAGTADVVTDKIKTITATGIETVSGKTLDADIIVTATGLKLQFLGGAAITVDSKPLNLADKYVWKGHMIQDVPNAVFVMGYMNASWTLGSDSTALQVSRLLKYMDKNGMGSATARVPEGPKMHSQPVINLSSTYIERAKSALPLAGDKGPWKPRLNYLTDQWEASYGSVTTDIDFVKASKKDV
jgi:cation diffusion facilitator CzcD-associated flavoprotein CzcO